MENQIKAAVRKLHSFCEALIESEKPSIRIEAIIKEIAKDDQNLRVDTIKAIYSLRDKSKIKVDEQDEDIIYYRHFMKINLIDVF